MLTEARKGSAGAHSICNPRLRRPLAPLLQPIHCDAIGAANSELTRPKTTSLLLWQRTMLNIGERVRKTAIYADLDTLSAIARQKSYCAPVVSGSGCVLDDSVMMQLKDGQQMTTDTCSPSMKACWCSCRRPERQPHPTGKIPRAPLIKNKVPRCSCARSDRYGNLRTREERRSARGVSRRVRNERASGRHATSLARDAVSSPRKCHDFRATMLQSYRRYADFALHGKSKSC